MKVPWSWLKEYVVINETPHEVMQKLTAVGHMQDGPAKPIAGDEVYDLEVRQNRSDCLSLVGVAREVSAVLSSPLNNPLADAPSISAPEGQRSITIHDPELCSRFNTVRLKIKPGVTPDWMKQRLEAYGMKSINNVIDVTNYVMIESGQPLHAFDTAKLRTLDLTIRTARSGEELVVLGGRTITLNEDDIVIADEMGPVALAGVIGGEHTGVNNDTTEILLEAATYNQASIRRTALRHTLRTEASTRLEKFLHPHGTELALARAVELLQELAGAEDIDTVDTYAKPFPPKSLQLTPQAVERLGGVSLNLETMQQLLQSEEISSQINDGALLVELPYWRTDLEQEADLVEEVLRLYGYDKIPDQMPTGILPKDIQSVYITLEEQLRDLMVSCGFDEQITEPLVNETEPRLKPVRLQNSLSSEKIMLRTTLNHQLLLGVQNRRRYRQEDIRLFEVGKVYFDEEDAPQEKRVLGAVLSGPQASYAKLKGVAELVLGRVGVDWNEDLAHIEIIDTTTFILTIDTMKLAHIPKQTRTRILTTPPQLVFEDWSLSVPTETAVGELMQAVRNTSPLIYQVQLGEAPREMDAQRKSVFLKVAYHDSSRTLSTQDIAPVREEVLSSLAQTFDAQRR